MTDEEPDILASCITAVVVMALVGAACAFLAGSATAGVVTALRMLEVIP